MVIDYLQYILIPNARPKVLLPREQKLWDVVSHANNVFDDSQIRKRTKELLGSAEFISVTDLGAGSKLINGNKRAVASIAKHATIRPKFGQLYVNIIKAFGITEAIELGTSFGIGTAYLAAACNTITTMEGCPQTAAIAQATFKKLKLNNVNLINSEFSEALQMMRFESDKPIFVYLDGNHQYKPTIDYFEIFRKGLPINSILVFDDIYWSKEMKAAWQYIQKQHYFTLDLYKVGIVILAEKSVSLPLKKRY